MKLPSRSKAYMIPEYSLTGDLLSFLTCNLQYRYQNKGTLPPSKPVQRWFGEFIHGVMEEAFIQWKQKKTEFPWDWLEDIRPIEEQIDLRLQARGLYPHDEDLFFSSVNNEDTNLNEHDHKKLASARAEKAINIWGKHLFPLIDSSELLIKGMGMKRPAIEVDDPKSENKWESHKQQILTYSWLRSQQEDSKSIYAGIIFYLNELVPSKEDLMLIKEEMENGLIDDETLEKYERDFDLITNWQEDDKAPELSNEFKLNRSIRIINIDKTEIDNSLEKFDKVVYDIEESLIKEMKGNKIQDAWKAEADERTCTACDFRTFCKNNKNKTKDFKIP